MIATIQILVGLLGVIAGVAIVARRLNTPPAILLVFVGVALAFIPGLPKVELAPEFVLLIVLPPLIYSSAVAMSWRQFRFNLRPISLLAVGCVVFTTVAAAAASHWLLGLAWPVAFVVGAIVSPPDAVAPLSIARGLGLPKRLFVILEGEGLVNDATALILYRFAVAAVSAGAFSLSHAAGTFALVVVGEIAWGLAVGWAMLRLRHWVRDPSVEIMLSILTPFLAYWPPEQLGGSGVLATVVTGLYFSWNGPRLISAATRLQGIFFWNFLIYLIEGMVFLLTGLQAHRLLAAISSYPVSELALSAAVVSGVVIATRFIWMYPATYLPRWLIPSLKRKDPSPPWQAPFALAFTGIRGIVSLAAALAIPETTLSGAPFPHRDLILFLAFCVILVTLVGQGLLLPTVIRWLGLGRQARDERIADRVEELNARRQAIQAAITHVNQLKAEHQVTDVLVGALHGRLRARLRKVENRAGDSPTAREAELDDVIEFELVGVERKSVNDLHLAGKLNDESRRQIELGFDLREAYLANRLADDRSLQIDPDPVGLE